MRIEAIEVEGLFGRFDYRIPLNQEERITILHAPNGFGKTILLKMVYGISRGEFSIFNTIPFRIFKVTFARNTHLVVRQSVYKKDIFDTRHKQSSTSLDVTYTIEGEEQGEPLSLNLPMSERLLYYINRKIPWLSKMEDDTWYDERLGAVLSSQEIISRYSDKVFGSEFRSRKMVQLPNWYKGLQKSLNTHLIRTQRLITMDEDDWGHKSRFRDRKRPTESAVINNANEIKSYIENVLTRYASVSQKLERTFPKRLIEEQSDKVELSQNEINSELKELEKKRSKLEQAGLWDKSQDIDFQVVRTANRSSLNVLALYIEDVKEKLKVFDELADKILLFKDIINDHFLYKSMEIDRERGFIFKTDEGEEIGVEQLSSGEQHELVLVYEMLFRVEPNSFILMDEPEISLHIVWQKKFLRDLSRILELNPFDVLMATHSPQIINDRWDLTVGLQEQVEKEPEHSAKAN